MKKPAPTLPPHPFHACRRAGVPIVLYETADPAVTIQAVTKALNGTATDAPLLSWDCCRALGGLNQPGVSYVDSIPEDQKFALAAPAATLQYIATHPPKNDLHAGILFFHLAHKFMDDPTVLQAVWNCREPLKAAGSTLVLLAPTGKLPTELKHDVVTLTESLPDLAQLGTMLDSLTEDAALPPEALNGQRAAVLDTLLGLTAFGAEQVLAMSLSPQGVDLPGLWDRKRRLIEQTPGLAVWRGGETFADLGGLNNLKSFLTRLVTSPTNPVRAVLFCDEIEKSLAGAAGDTSGTSQDQLGVLLKVMQDDNIPGIILIGPPGTGKSAIAKAAGNVAQAPVIACDLGAMKGSLVGESEARIRAAMDVFKAVSQGKGLVIATCNKLAILPPELRRRFTLGTFYVDLPTEAEATAIWLVWLKRYGLKATEPLPPCEQWSGAEIRACCDVAYRTGMSLREAAAFIVPVSKSAADSIEQLRSLAAGKFISASRPGTYSRETAVTTTTKRRITT